MNIFRINLIKSHTIVFCCLCILTLSGCGHKGLYSWGDYENSLYERYMENNSEQAVIYLQTSIDDAIKENRRVPPGIYADYGFMLYQRGDKKGAISFFEKEKLAYPESKILMTKLIERVTQKNLQTKQGTTNYNKVMP